MVSRTWSYNEEVNGLIGMVKYTAERSWSKYEIGRK